MKMPGHGGYPVRTKPFHPSIHPMMMVVVVVVVGVPPIRLNPTLKVSLFSLCSSKSNGKWSQAGGVGMPVVVKDKTKKIINQNAP